MDALRRLLIKSPETVVRNPDGFKEVIQVLKQHGVNDSGVLMLRLLFLDVGLCIASPLFASGAGFSFDDQLFCRTRHRLSRSAGSLLCRLDFHPTMWPRW